MKKFFVMTRGRTGSTAVMDSLNKTDSITAAQELFIKYKVNKSSQPQRNNERVMTRYDLWRQQNMGLYSIVLEKVLRSDAWITKYLEQIENKVSVSGVQAFGFKVISHHFVQRPKLKETLVGRGYSALYLTRNIPRQVISGMVAKKRGKYNAHEKENYQCDVSYVLDVHTFKSLIRLEQRSQQDDLKLIESLGVDYTTISYEDFVSHPDQLFSEIFSFLNLPPERAPKSSFDIMIKDLREVVGNYEQIDECTRELGMSLD